MAPRNKLGGIAMGCILRKLAGFMVVDDNMASLLTHNKKDLELGVELKLSDMQPESTYQTF